MNNDQVPYSVRPDPWPKDRSFPWAKMADLIEQSQGIFGHCTGQLVKPPKPDSEDDVIQACAMGHAYLSAGVGVFWMPDGEVCLADDREEKLAKALGLKFLDWVESYAVFKDVSVADYYDQTNFDYIVNPVTAIIHMNDTLRWPIERIVATCRELAAEEALTQEDAPAEV